MKTLIVTVILVFLAATTAVYIVGSELSYPLIMLRTLAEHTRVIVPENDESVSLEYVCGDRVLALYNLDSKKLIAKPSFQQEV
jgi:hypothetical protein